MEVLLPLINSPQAIFPIKSISGNEEQDKSHSLILLLSIKLYSLVTFVGHGVFHSKHTLIDNGESQFQNMTEGKSPTNQTPYHKVD